MLNMVNLITGGGSTCLEMLKAEGKDGVLAGLTKTRAIVSSFANAKGITKAIEFGFPKKDIYVVDPTKNLAEQLLTIFSHYDVDYFRQLGWMPQTPAKVLQRYKGTNQHFGPGGKWMYGVRRVYAHKRFCEAVGENLPIPVFCQLVASEYDEGGIIHVEYVQVNFLKTPETIADELLPIEHRVQIEGSRKLALGIAKIEPVPQIARNEEEAGWLEEIKREARDKYPVQKS